MRRARRASGAVFLRAALKPEIARLTGTPVGTVASRLRRARELFVTVHGGIGYTGMARYGNVSNWFIDTAFGFSGFFLNKYTGRCITDSGTSARESNCDGRDQGNDIQWWTLSGTVTPNVFYIRNGSTGKCLDLETTANEAALVTRTCNAAAAPTNTQHWRFDPTNHSDYRLLVNAQTGRCTAPSNRSDEQRASFLSLLDRQARARLDDAQLSEAVNRTLPDARVHGSVKLATAPAGVQPVLQPVRVAHAKPARSPLSAATRSMHVFSHAEGAKT